MTKELAPHSPLLEQIAGISLPVAEQSQACSGVVTTGPPMIQQNTEPETGLVMHEGNYDSRSDRWCFIDLPLELFLIVLEWAILSDRSTASTLRLVSKKVCKWITPIVYETFLFQEKDDDGYDLAFLRHSHMIKHLFISNSMCIWDHEIIHRCSQLRYLVIDAGMLPTDSSTIPSLTHVVIYGIATFGDLESPILRSATHLQCSVSPNDLLAANLSPENLPKLTHLVLKTSLLRYNLLGSCLASLSAFTNIHVLGFYLALYQQTGSIYNHGHKTPIQVPDRQKWIVYGVRYTNLVLLTPDLSLSHSTKWDEWVRCDESPWEEAERLLNARGDGIKHEKILTSRRASRFIRVDYRPKQYRLRTFPGPE